MDSERHIRVALLASILCGALLAPAGAPLAAAFPEFVDPNPAPGNQFGATVVPLSTGNVVITSPFDDAGGADAGAVYLFNGSTGALISTLRGSTPGDNLGNNGGVIALTNGNYLVRSTSWDNGAVVNAGAVTWGSGTSGVSGVISPANSLVGSTASDQVGFSVTALTNGNYVVASPNWDNGAVVNAGAVTWGSGTTGVSGVVSAANSLVGSTASDLGSSTVTALTNGNYVVASSGWDNGAIANAGAATWGSGTSGVSGVVSAANSLVGSTASDAVGSGVTALTNGDYVVRSSSWDNGAVVNAGAVTWGSGMSGLIGVVSAANSLVGSTASDQVGSSSVTALTNGNYVVASQNWDNGAVANAGAVTWGSGASGVSGVVSAANSLVGSTASDNVGFGAVTALANGNFVVLSLIWQNGAVANAGAVTWGSGTSGVSGVVSAANSLVGSTASDLASSTVTALTNGSYVVASQSWDNGAVANVGAATWGSGTSGVSGVISAANSLVGSTASDFVGSGGVTALTNGNYVVASSFWDNGAVASAGAVTWGSGTSGVSGVISAANSLVGSTASDEVGSRGVTALTNGNYVVASPLWHNGAGISAGAATWGSGTSGVSGVVSAANSLVGSTASDAVGSGVTALTNGNYVVRSSSWDNGAVVNAGAATWGSGTSGVSGVVSAANSLVGSTASDQVGSSGVTALTNGNYVVASPNWDNGAVANAGAATWGSGTTGVSGVISAANSLVGTSASTNLQPVVADDVNETFMARFIAEGGGRVRVGRAGEAPEIVSAVDIPADQGGWVRLTFIRASADVPSGPAPVAIYGVWRHVPGTLPAGVGRTNPGAALGPRLDARTTERLRTTLPAGLDVWEAEGRLYVVGPGSRVPGIAAAFPPGTWALIASVPAQQQAQYVADIPTISNAAPNDFVLSAHTTTPSIWFLSDPVSAQSVDNLAPAPPTGLSAAYANGQTDLQWAPNTEHDLGSYRLYRGGSADFTPSIGNLIATQIATSYADVGPPGSYYKLSAVDVNGNESGFALIGPGTTGVEGGAPVAFALEGARPNPASGSGLYVAFALPSAAAARLALFDVSGRQVLSREVGALGAGRHTVNLAEDRKVAAGLYWVRLTQAANERTTRVAVIE